jgi:hypothetical protein
MMEVMEKAAMLKEEEGATPSCQRWRGFVVDVTCAGGVPASSERGGGTHVDEGKGHAWGGMRVEGRS